MKDNGATLYVGNDGKIKIIKKSGWHGQPLGRWVTGKGV